MSFLCLSSASVRQHCIVNVIFRCDRALLSLPIYFDLNQRLKRKSTNRLLHQPLMEQINRMFLLSTLIVLYFLHVFVISITVISIDLLSLQTEEGASQTRLSFLSYALTPS